MSDAPPGRPTTVDDVLAFFDREPVDVERTSYFAEFDESKLAHHLAERLGEAFPGIAVNANVPLTSSAPGAKQFRSDDDAPALADVIIRLPEASATIVVEIKREISPEHPFQLERYLNVLSGPNDPSPIGVLLLVGPISDSEQAASLESAARELQSAVDHRIVVLLPQRAWPVFFEDYGGAADQQSVDKARQAAAAPNKAAKEKAQTEPGGEADRDAAQRDAARIYMLSDDALKGREGDRLGFDAYAAAFGGLINDKDTKTPLTLAINAKWGVGKTSLARMISEHLVEGRQELSERPHVVYWFNAWMHDEATDLGQAFMTDIVRFANGLRPWWRRWLRPLPSELCSEEDYKRRRKWLGVLIVLSALALSYALVDLVGIDVFKLLGLKETTAAGEQLKTTYGSIVVMFVLSFALLRYLGDAYASVSTFLSMQAAPVDTGSLGRVRRHLRRLIKAATPPDTKFVVFIDDLERCRPTRSIDVLEVVNQLLSVEPVVTIIVADMAALAANAEIKYAALAQRYNPETGETGKQVSSASNAYGRLFLQKFVQLQFDLPEPSDTQIRRLIASLSARPADGDDASRRSAARVSAWLYRQFGAVGTVVASLGPTLFASWRPRAPTGTLLRHHLNGAPWSLRPLALMLWVPLVPYLWTTSLGLRLVGLQQLRPATGPSAWFGKSAIMACVILTGYFLGLFAKQQWVGLFGWTILTAEDVAVTMGLVGTAGAESAPPVYATEIARLADYGVQIGFAYLPALAAGIAVAGLGLYQRVQIAREQRSRAAAFENEIKSGATNKAPARPQDSRLGDHAWQALYLRKRQQYLTKDSTLFTQARDYAFQHVLPVPRNAKRLLNRLRLNLFILDQQDAFADQVEFGPLHLGKWVALHERWPEVAVSLVRAPETIEPIEAAIPATAKSLSATARKKLVRALGTLDGVHAEDPALHDLLAAAPRLAPVIRRLTMFEIPAAAPAAAGEAAPSP